MSQNQNPAAGIRSLRSFYDAGFRPAAVQRLSASRVRAYDQAITKFLEFAGEFVRLVTITDDVLALFVEAGRPLKHRSEQAGMIRQVVLAWNPDAVDKPRFRPPRASIFDHELQTWVTYPRSTTGVAINADTPVAIYFERAYCPDRLPGKHHGRTRKDYESQITKLEWFFTKQLREQDLLARPLTLADLSDPLLKLATHYFLEHGYLGQANGTASANKLLRTIKSIWNLAWEQEIVDRQCRTRPYREIKRKPRCWLPEQVEKIVAASFHMPGQVGEVPAATWWPTLLLVALNTGSRINALMSVRREDVDLDRREIFIRGEHEKHRTDESYDLFPSAVDALKRLAPHKRKLDRVFQDWRCDPSGNWTALRRHFRMLLVRAGIFEKPEDAGSRDLFHGLRRVVATRIAAKFGAEEARRFLGHSAIRVTEMYIDPQQAPRRRASELLSDPMSGDQSAGSPTPE